MRIQPKRKVKMYMKRNRKRSEWIGEVRKNQAKKEKKTLNVRRNVKEERWANITRKQGRGG